MPTNKEEKLCCEEIKNRFMVKLFLDEEEEEPEQIEDTEPELERGPEEEIE